MPRQKQGKPFDRIRLTEKLQDAVDAENMMQFCCEHLARVVQNGPARCKFTEFSEVAHANKQLLAKHADRLQLTRSSPAHTCKYCTMAPESFSLYGALNLSLEVSKLLVRLYRDLALFSDDPGDSTIYKEIAQERSAQRDFLKSEKKYADKGNEEQSFIDSFCLPDIVSRLWR